MKKNLIKTGVYAVPTLAVFVVALIVMRNLGKAATLAIAFAAIAGVLHYFYGRLLFNQFVDQLEGKLTAIFGGSATTTATTTTTANPAATTPAVLTVDEAIKLTEGDLKELTDEQALSAFCLRMAGTKNVPTDYEGLVAMICHSAFRKHIRTEDEMVRTRNRLENAEATILSLREEQEKMVVADNVRETALHTATMDKHRAKRDVAAKDVLTKAFNVLLDEVPEMHKIRAKDKLSHAEKLRDLRKELGVEVTAQEETAPEVAAAA